LQVATTLVCLATLLGFLHVTHPISWSECRHATNWVGATPSAFFPVFWLRGSLSNFVWAGLKPTILLPPLLE
jgi:hypothetical protein